MIDVSPFISATFAVLKDEGAKLTQDATWYRDAVLRMEQDVSALATDYAASTDPLVRAECMRLIVETMPERKTFLVAAAEANLGKRAADVVDGMLVVAGHVLVALIKSVA